MKVFFERTPALARRILPQAIWSLPERRHEIFLTFDDGPHPEFTSSVLELLAAHNARATFFLVGEKAQAHPQLVREILSAGHALGNHTMHHRPAWAGWQRSIVVQEEITAARDLLENCAGVPVRYFRPPYGALSPAVIGGAKNANLVLTMWSCMPLDFRRANNPQAIATSLVKHARGGDIILLHDGHACTAAMLMALRETIPLFKQRGYHFSALSNSSSSARL